MTTIPDFETICKHKDADSSNLNDVFASYGCSTLEAKVPVVNKPVIESIRNAAAYSQVLATLALKSESGSMAMKGRPPRTRNKELRIVEVSGEVMLEAGAERDRSPVDRGELDDELELYARERERLRAHRMGLEMPEDDFPLPGPSRLSNPPKREFKKERLSNKENSNDKEEEEEDWDKSEPAAEDLDEDLDRYMREAQRMRAQRRQLNEQSDRMDVMMRMEDDSELS